MEIGSIFEINPEATTATIKSNEKLSLIEVNKFMKSNVMYTGSGREAVLLALHSIEAEKKNISKVCLMPAYMCDSVMIPFEKMGWKLCFYHLGKNLKIEKEELEKLIKKNKPSVIFIHNYFGHETWAEVRPMLHKHQEQGLIIIEDITQQMFGRVFDRDADYIVGSLRKWYPIPDGGFLATDKPIAEIEYRDNEAFAARRMEILTSKWNYLVKMADSLMEETERALQESKKKYLADNRAMEEELDAFDGVSRMSKVGEHLMGREDEMINCVTRHENYKMLYNALQNMEGIELVFKDFSKLVAPLYFPVYVDKREEFQKYLADNGIYAPVLWPMPKYVQGTLNDDEKYIYEHMLCLPCDYRYGIDHMKHVIEVITDKYVKIYR